MIRLIKRLFCRHDDEVVKKVDPSGFQVLSGDQLYLRCKKCGRVKKFIFAEYNDDGTGYK